jgi:hypothetical protein
VLAGAPSIVNAPAVNIEGGSRGLEADRELAGKIASQVRDASKAEINSGIRQQMRPGGMLYHR